MWSIMMVGLVALNVLDYLITAFFIRSGGFEVEANPVAREFGESLGLAGMLLFKLSVIVFVVAAIHIIKLRRPIAARRLLAAFCGIMLAVVIYNLWLIRVY